MAQFWKRASALALAAQTCVICQDGLRWRGMQPAAVRPAQQTAPRRNLLRTHSLIQYAETPTREQIAALTARGAVILSVVPENGFTVSVPNGVSLSNLGLQWFGPLLPEEKLSPEIATWKGTDWVVEFHSDVDENEARAVVLTSGLTLKMNAGLLSYHVLASGPITQLTQLAKWDEVAYVFPAAPELLTGGRAAGCIGAITTAGTTATAVPTIGDGWDGPGQGRTALSYVFQSVTAKAPADQVKSEIVRAFSNWSQAVAVTFSAGTSVTGAKTVDVLFATGSHGDPYPFDGPGGVLAHTFYPYPVNPEPIAGDMHFDDSESWNTGADIDVFSVALHETGHALGLGHSTNPADVMYPYYRRAASLSAGDIAAAQLLYAAATATGKTAPAPTPDPAPSPSPTPAPTPPASIQIQTPTATGSYSTASPTVVLIGTASNGAGISSVSWTNGAGTSGTATGTTQWTTGALALAMGTNLIQVTVHGKDGKQATATIVVTRTGGSDTVPPTLTITSPTTVLLSTNGVSIQLSGTAEDNVGVSAVTWKSSTGVYGTASGTAKWSTPQIPLLQGINAIMITAQDAAGNRTWRSVQVIRH